MKKQNIILLVVFLIGIGLIYLGLNINNNIPDPVHYEQIKNNALSEITYQYPRSIEVNGKIVYIDHNGSIKNETH